MKMFVPGTSRLAYGLPLAAEKIDRPELIRKGLIYKSISGQPPISVNDQGRVTFVANSTGVIDAQSDNCLPGCWQSALTAKMPKIHVGHQHQELPVGKVVSLRELMPGSRELPIWHQQNGAGALIATAQFNMQSPDGIAAFTAIKGGYADEFSVGFTVAADGEERDYRGKQPIRKISKVERLVEISVVTMGASPATQVLALKTLKAANPELSEDELLRLMSLLEDMVWQKLLAADEARRQQQAVSAAQPKATRELATRELAIKSIRRRVANH